MLQCLEETNMSIRRSFAWAFLAVVAVSGAAGAQGKQSVTIKSAKDQLDFYIGSDLVTSYHTGTNCSKPILWPLNAPCGVPLTRAWPMVKGTPGETTDHVHQKSAWFCHGDVIPEGIELKSKTAEKGGRGVDFWSEAKDKDGKPRHGTIVSVTVDEPK